MKFPHVSGWMVTSLLCTLALIGVFVILMTLYLSSVEEDLDDGDEEKNPYAGRHRAHWWEP